MLNAHWACRNLRCSKSCRAKKIRTGSIECSGCFQCACNAWITSECSNFNAKNLSLDISQQHVWCAWALVQFITFPIEVHYCACVNERHRIFKICRLQLERSLNLSPQLPHENGFSPVWSLACRCKLERSLKRSPHIPQAKGFSPVWILLCRSKLWFEVNERWQRVHSCLIFSEESRKIATVRDDLLKFLNTYFMIFFRNNCHCLIE